MYAKLVNQLTMQKNNPTDSEVKERNKTDHMKFVD